MFCVWRHVKERTRTHVSVCGDLQGRTRESTVKNDALEVFEFEHEVPQLFMQGDSGDVAAAFDVSTLCSTDAHKDFCNQYSRKNAAIKHSQAHDEVGVLNMPEEEE